MLVAAAASRAPPPRAAWSRRSTGCTTQTYFFVFVVLMGTSFVLFLQQYHAASNFIEQIQNEADTAVPRRPSQRGIQAADPPAQTQRGTAAVSSSSSSLIELLRHLKTDTIAVGAAGGSRNTSATQTTGLSPFSAWANTQQEATGKEQSKPKHDHNKKKQESEQQPPPPQDPHPQRLNVVLFYADDWTMKVLGALDPHHIVKTPHLDAMASRGMLFTNNCVTTSVCWMSRSTLSTGTYGAIHQHHMPFQEAVFETQHWNDTLYPKMKQAHRTTTTNHDDTEGYYTGLFGKWHKLELQDELKQAFHEHKIYYGNHWETRNGQSRHVTDLNQDDALDFLQRWNQRRHEQPHKRQQKTHKQKSVYQPFFLTMSFFATHAEDGKIPSYRPKNETRLGTYPDWPLSPQVPVPKTATELHYQQLPRFLIGEGNNEGRMRWRNRFEPHNFQNSIKDMYSMATEVDTAVGAVMQQIKQMDDDVYNNTVFIFTTDNGNMHGEHGLAEKWYPFEESIRVPLVIQDPRMPEHRKGTRNDAWTLNVDLPTTILGVANIPPAPFMQGRNIADLYLDEHEDARVVSSSASSAASSLSSSAAAEAAVAAKKHHPILSNDALRKKVQWRDAWFYEFNLGTNLDGSAHPWKNFIDASFALVTDEWKYVVWPQQDHYEQLFHRSVDPYDEWDLIARILEQKRNQQQNTKHTSTANTTTRMTTTKDSPFVSRRRQLESIVSEGAHNNNNNNNNGNNNIQTTLQVYEDMKQRYHELKAIAQSGAKI